VKRYKVRPVAVVAASRTRGGWLVAAGPGHQGPAGLAFVGARQAARAMGRQEPADGCRSGETSTASGRFKAWAGGWPCLWNRA
jgi:hypothetical protein